MSFGADPVRVTALTSTAQTARYATPLRVADLMNPSLLSCSRDASLRTVAKVMVDNQVHCVVITDDPSDAAALWGIVSDLDLIAAASVRGLEEQQAGASAMTPAVTISPGETVEYAAGLMTRYGVSHLIVVDPVTRRPAGVLSTLDLAVALADR
jgi:CBS domain-containing protein